MKKWGTVLEFQNYPFPNRDQSNLDILVTSLSGMKWGVKRSIQGLTTPFVMFLSQYLLMSLLGIYNHGSSLFSEISAIE
jgi:hypothetical protein